MRQGWNESVYQQAMEVALREKGIDYKDQQSHVAKYTQELKKQIKSDEKVLDTGFVINFVTEGSKKFVDEVELLSGR